MIGSIGGVQLLCFLFFVFFALLYSTFAGCC